MKNTYKFYIAYGSNLNLKQMAIRCPSSTVAAKAELQGYRLRFRGYEHSAVATIEKHPGSTVPVLVWKLACNDEKYLDHYEGFPHLYRKENLPLSINGKRIIAMVYIMNEASHPYGTPSKSYFQTILDGYISAGFDPAPLYQAANIPF